MADISATDVKKLRDRTSAGMMDCKKALQECNGDMEAAVDWLRQKGLAKAANKAGRATSEGVIASRVAPDNSCAVMVEVKCETDFVARGDRFQTFATEMADLVYDKKPVDAMALQGMLGDMVTNQIATLGENMSVGRPAHLTVSGTGIISCYIHATGKIGVLVELACTKADTVKNPALMELAHNIAMQVAAANPVALDSASIDPAFVARERAVYRQKTLDEGKPAAIVDKIVDGRIQKFFQEVCLMEQVYIRDDKLTIKELLKEQGKTMGDALAIRRFTRLQLGEDNA